MQVSEPLLHLYLLSTFFLPYRAVDNSIAAPKESYISETFISCPLSLHATPDAVIEVRITSVPHAGGVGER